MGSLQSWNTTVAARPRIISSRVQLPRILLASSSFPSPMRTTAREPPPMPTRAEMAETNRITGKQMPRPVRARSPSPGMCPM